MSLNHTIMKTACFVGILSLTVLQANAQTTNTAKNLFELTPEAEPVTTENVAVTQQGLIDLDLRDQDITQVLNLLSLQSQRNIIPSPGVTGTVSGRVYGADLYEVLDGLLTPYNLAYREDGNFIHVYTKDELKATEEANSKLVLRIVRLNYITADEAKTFVNPLLSAAGKITTNTKVEAGFEAEESDGGANGFAHSETVIVRDNKKNTEEICKVLEELDRRPEQVLIESTILRATLTEDNQFGVDITAVADMTIGQASEGPLSIINDLVEGSITGSANAFQTNFGNATASSGTQIGFVRDGVAAFIHALDSVVDTTVVANPKLLVLNRQRAIVEDTIERAVLTTETVDTTTSTSVEMVPSGTILRIRPFISSDNFIRMELKPEISTGTRVDLGETQGIDKDQQSMITNVMVRNSNTVVLGGLIREENTVTRQQTPFLGDVPLLGAAFRDQGDSVKRTETIFLVTPTIVRDESLYAEGEKMQDNVRTAQFGSRQGLLPFSRTKMVSDHMRNALTCYKAGMNQRALMNIEMALRLDSNYHQARTLKAKILDKLNEPSDQFYLDDYSKQIIEKQLQQPPKVIDISAEVDEQQQPMKKTVNQTASVPVE